MDSTYSPQSFAELIDTFPEAIPAARRAAKNRVKHLNTEIAGLTDLREIWSNDINKMHFSRQPGMIAYLDDYIERLRSGYEKDIKKEQYKLDYLANYGKPKKVTGDAVTPERIARARAFPISELIEVKRGQALCPFHNDHRPSMKIYPDNHAYCFAEGRSADSIDIYMTISGTDFRSAVRYLAP